MKRLTTVLLLLLTVTLWGQGTWTFDGQVRHRFERMNVDFNKDTKAQSVNLLRSRLGFKYQNGENLYGYIQIQDARVWGEEGSTLFDGDADNMDFHQAYVKIRNLLGLPITMKLGRMEVKYGNERFFGDVNFYQNGQSFDGVIFKYKGERYKIDIFNLKETEAFNFGDLGDKNVLGIYSHLDLFKDYKTQLFLFNDRQEYARNLNRFTVGFYAAGEQGDLKHTTEFAYQLGRINGLDVSAYMFALNIGYKLSNMSYNPEIWGGIDYLSGDDDATDANYNTFNTLYADNHKFYGYMDYFFNIPGNTFGAGLMDIHVKVAFEPIEKMNAIIKFHNFQAAKDITLLNGDKSKTYGNEIDFKIKYPANDQVVFKAGYSIFMPGNIFKDYRGDDTSNWFYLMTVVNLN
ncbi:MAG: alginate export family protein [Calditrichia bacterium]